MFDRIAGRFRGAALLLGTISLLGAWLLAGCGSEVATTQVESSDFQATVAPVPRLFVADSTIELADGDWKDGVARREIAIENRGDAPLHIHSIASSCGCSVGTISSNHLQPGAASTLSVQVERDGRPSGFVTIDLISDDPAERRKSVRVEWANAKKLEWSPYTIELGRIPTGAVRDFQAEVVFRGGGTLTEAALQGLRLETSEPEDDSRLTVEPAPFPFVKGRLVAGERTGPVAIKAVRLADDSGKLASLVVRYEVVPFVTAIPPAVAAFDRNDAEGPHRVTFSAFDGSTPRVAEVRCEPPERLRTSRIVAANDARENEIEVVFEPPEPGAIVSASLFVRCTAVDDEYVVAIPVSLAAPSSENSAKEPGE